MIALTLSMGSSQPGEAHSSSISSDLPPVSSGMIPGVALLPASDKAHVGVVVSQLSPVKLRHRASATGDGDAAAIAVGMDSSLSISLTQAPSLADVSNENVPQRGGGLLNRDDWLPMPGETVWTYTKRLCTEGHTVPDAFLTCACGQIGQILLNSPNALFKMGILGGSISMFVFLLCGYWTIYEFMCMYLELRRKKMQDGSWWETDGKHRRVMQMFEAFGLMLGPWARISSLIVLLVVLIGLLMLQINACAVNMYWVGQSRTKRQWSLIYGGIMVFTMILFPKFTMFRLINIFGLVTTLCTSIFIIAVSVAHGFQPSAVPFWPYTSQNYFTGAAVWLTILGTHAVTFETLESMEQPKHFKTSFSAAWVWTILVTIPAAFCFNFAYPDYLVYLQEAGKLPYADNVFSLLGNTAKGIPGTGQALDPPRLGILWNLGFCSPTVTQTKYAMAILMNIHQFVAFALFGTSVAYIWEKAWGVHTKPWYIRIPVRIPLSGFIWFLAILCPFYGALNSLFTSIGIPYLGFVLPSLCLLVWFRSRQQLRESSLPPYNWVIWVPQWLSNRYEASHPYLVLMCTPWWWVCFAMLTIFAGFGGTATYYSIKLIADSFSTFGAFAECYSCIKQLNCPSLQPPPPPAVAASPRVL